MRRERVVLVLILIVLAAVSWLAREAQNRRVELPGREGWFTTDPDTQYHVRRVERALEEGLPASEHDARLNAPLGSAIPWPPYYTTLLWATLAPFAPSEGRAPWVERHVASAACVASVLATLLAACAAWRLGGALAALGAGLLHALCGAAIEYGKPGNGDHHAFVSLIAGALLLLFALSLEDGADAGRRRSRVLGPALGALAGLALGSWVASLVLVAQLQLALLVLLFRHARRPLAGLGAFGLSFHLAALVAVLPAVLSSPWKDEHPWIVVNLSWFHLAYLGAGALVCAPLALRPADESLRRRMPWLAVALSLLGLAWIAFGESGPPRGVREGFEWVSRVDSFMARIGESQPLVRDGSFALLFRTLGYGVLVLPVAWLAALRWFVRGELRWLPWVVATPPLVAQALQQARFAEGLALPMAVVLGVSLARWVESARPRRLPLGVSFASVAVVCAALSWPSLERGIERFGSRRDAIRFERPSAIGARLAAEWIGLQPRRQDDETVLALWSHGHLIERVAGRGSIATNFGSYVGEDGFRASPEMLLCEDEAELVARMEERKVRYLLVDSDLPNALNTLLDGVDPERRARYVAVGSESGGQVRPAWFRTIGARALFGGEVFGPEAASARALSRLRLVWSAPLADPSRPLRGPRDLAPAASVWELVPGGLVHGTGAPGERLEVILELAYPNGQQVTWRAAATVDAGGSASVRVPYSTARPNGQGVVQRATWRVGSREGIVEVDF